MGQSAKQRRQPAQPLADVELQIYCAVMDLLAAVAVYRDRADRSQELDTWLTRCELAPHTLKDVLEDWLHQHTHGQHFLTPRQLWERIQANRHRHHPSGAA